MAVLTSLFYCTCRLGLALCLLRCRVCEVSAFHVSWLGQMLNVTSLSLVTGVRSNPCDPLPVGVGRHSASLLRSSRSPRFTTRSWNNKSDHWFLHLLPYQTTPPYLGFNAIPWPFGFSSTWPLIITPFPTFQIAAGVSPSSLKELDPTQPSAKYLHIGLILGNRQQRVSLTTVYFPVYSGWWDIWSGTYRKIWRTCATSCGNYSCNHIAKPQIEMIFCVGI